MRNIDANELIVELESFDPGKATYKEKLRLAQAALQFAIGLMTQVAEETKDRHAEAYLIDHLKTKASADHGFLSRDFNIDEWVERITEEGDNDDDSPNRP